MNFIIPVLLALLISLIPFAGVNGQIAELGNTMTFSNNVTEPGNTNMTTTTPSPADTTSSDNATYLISVEEEDKCSTKIGSAGMGFPREDRTECELGE